MLAMEIRIYRKNNMYIMFVNWIAFCGFLRTIRVLLVRWSMVCYDRSAQRQLMGESATHHLYFLFRRMSLTAGGCSS